MEVWGKYIKIAKIKKRLLVGFGPNTPKFKDSYPNLFFIFIMITDFLFCAL